MAARSRTAEVPDTGGVLDRTAAAKYCGVAPKTLSNLCAAGQGPTRCGKGRWSKRELDRWIAQNTR